MSTPEQEMMTKIARVETRMDAIATDITEIKQTLRDVVAMERMLTQVATEQAGLKDDVSRLDGRLEGHAHWQRSHDNWEATERDRVEMKFSTFAAFQNRMRGGIIVLSALAGLSGSVSAWVLLHTIDADSTNRVQEQRLLQLERLLTIDRVRRGD